MSLSAPSVLPPLLDLENSNGRRAFVPRVVNTFEEAGLSHAMVESLILKFLLNLGTATGRRIAAELGLPFGPFPEFLRQLKNQQIVNYSSAGTASDFVYSLTDVGRARAKIYLDECTYVGTAPVPFEDYLDSVSAQTIATEHPKEDDLRRAFADLLISEQTFGMLGPAINSGRGLFLYGFPGNGKTSIAERITRCFGSSVWIPRVLCIEGQLIKVFDMANHEPIEESQSDGLLSAVDHDRRWVHVRRPTIVAGGELRMDDLEIRYDPMTKVSEAPLQLKSNLGSFLIDDFGRQRMQPVELLNRWIVPLEKRYDFLSLANGKKVRVPFDQLIIFSTNLEPKQLVDEAFLQAHSVQDSRGRSVGSGIPRDDRNLRTQARLPIHQPGSCGSSARSPLQAMRSPVPLLPAARSLAPGQKLLHLQRPAAGDEARVLRLCRRQLLHRHVSRRRGSLTHPPGLWYHLQGPGRMVGGRGGMPSGVRV